MRLIGTEALISVLALSVNLAAADISNYDCLTSLQQLGFNNNFYSFAKYPCYFRNTSYIKLAQAGIYIGPDSMEEYIRFASESCPYFRSWEILDTEFKMPTVTSIDQATNTCTIRASNHVFAKLSKPFGGASFELAIMVQLLLNRDEMYIPAVHVHFPTTFIRPFMSALASPAGRRYVCRTMEESCPSTWAANGFDSAAACVAELSTRNETDGPWAHFDADTQGCRLLHAVFANENSDHCAHISLTPMADPNGVTKCHVSSGYSPMDMFSEDDMNQYESYAAKRGLPGGVKLLTTDRVAQCRNFSSNRCVDPNEQLLCPDGKKPADDVLSFIWSALYKPGCSTRLPIPPFPKVPPVCTTRPTFLERLQIPLFIALCFHVSFFFLELVLVSLDISRTRAKQADGLIQICGFPLLVICFTNTDTLSSIVYILFIWHLYVSPLAIPP